MKRPTNRPANQPNNLSINQLMDRHSMNKQLANLTNETESNINQPFKQKLTHLNMNQHEPTIQVLLFSMLLRLHGALKAAKKQKAQCRPASNLPPPEVVWSSFEAFWGVVFVRKDLLRYVFHLNKYVAKCYTVTHVVFCSKGACLKHVFLENVCRVDFLYIQYGLLMLVRGVVFLQRGTYVDTKALDIASNLQKHTLDGKRQIVATTWHTIYHPKTASKQGTIRIKAALLCLQRHGGIGWIA